MASPKVSVLIDTFNHEPYIEQAIESVLTQELPDGDVEIVVVDDGSADRTSEIVRKFEPGIRLIRKENGGQASALNAGIRELHAPVVAFLDGDDWWAPRKLQAVLETFEKNPGIAAVGHGFFEVKEFSKPTEILAPERSLFLDLASAETARLADLGRTLLGASRLAVRRKILDRIGPLPENLRFCADTPILTLALALGGAVVLQEPLCYYRIHSSNLFAGAADRRKLSQKAEVLEFLLRTLPVRIRELGVGEIAAETLFASDRLELDRLQVELGRAGRWKAMRTEMKDFRFSYKNRSLSYAAFRTAAALLALLLPPQRFYALRQWYGRRNFVRFRSRFAPAEPVVPTNLLVRRPVTTSET